MPEIILLVSVVFGFIFVGNYVQAQQKDKKERLRILEEAIRSGHVDAETKREIVESLRGGRSASGFLFGVGWIAFFVGIAMLCVRDTATAGFVVTGAGLALLTLPIAYREVEARKRA